MNKVKLFFDWFSNMGFRYVGFRILHELSVKLGLLKFKFPVNPKNLSIISLEKWRKQPSPFFFYGKDIIGLEKKQDLNLEAKFKEIRSGCFTYFSKEKYELGKNYDWITNPITNYKYNIDTHWSKIQDLSSEAGDIKFVWEKARFSFLMDIIRYDYHFDTDCSDFVFSEIESFIDSNPINQGPNYKCSQEISLRIINWTFALYYYKDSDSLNEILFKKIINSIYWQIHHVYKNIHFSRIAVRNNHALTETLLLYISGLLFPFLPNVKKWSKKGKLWFEKEIKYQIYPDGTFLQYSMNYHRVTIQLLSLGIRLSELNNKTFDSIVKERASKSLSFLKSCSNKVNGKLPNYGNNDGALFFKFTSDDYTDYRSQLNDLDMVLNGETETFSEGIFWLGFDKTKLRESLQNQSEIKTFENGGYYIAKDDNTLTFIRCGAYKDRPSQSDNLHVDIWVEENNVFRDSGTYKYNAPEEFTNYFNGCEGHNTISINRKDQMTKGGRFIWYNWVKKAKGELIEEEDSYLFKGQIKAFHKVNTDITHRREVTKKKGILEWEIIDYIDSSKVYDLTLFWHINPEFKSRVEIKVINNEGEDIFPIEEEKWFSPYYGYKEPSIRYSYNDKTTTFKTLITIK